MNNTAVKLPGGCYLTDREELKKINTRQLDLIPFKRYRFDPDPVDMVDPDDRPLHWTEVGFIASGIISLMVGCLGSGIGSILACSLGLVITAGFAMIME